MSDHESNPSDEGHTKATPPAASDEGEPRDTVEDDELDGDDLFGDGGDDEEPASPRKLDDEELDSGDDEGRNDRAPEEQNAVEAEEQTLAIMDADIARHSVPEPSDGELYLLRVPQFLSIEPIAYHHKTFQPPTTDHHSRQAPSEHFSPFNTAMTTIRWRRSPSNPAELQSNARILRWSDGSLTLQLANQPLEQYEISATTLAPPQINPKLPTPTSRLQKSQAAQKQGYTFLAAPYEEAQVMRVTNRFTTQLRVDPTANSEDGALEVLQSALAKAAGRTLDSQSQAISFFEVDEDPELVRARKEAEHKERLKQQRAREKNEMKEREKATRRMGGGARTAGYGLSLGGLHDDDGGRRGGARKPRAKAGLRRDWSDDEEEYDGRGRNRQDEYDEEDDFIAASDEEPEIVEDDDDDDGIMDSPPRRGRETSSPKRNRRGEEDEDEDVVVSRTKRRRVVEDDDDDE